MSRTHRRSYRRGRLHAGEEGQALVLWALCLTVIIGMAGLVLDGSNLQNNRRKLQNAADAAAFAGAQDLPASPSHATTEDLQWLTANGSSGGEVTTNAVSTTTVANDTLTVSLRRTVSYSFMRVLGLSSGNVTATAKVQVVTATQGSVGCGGFVPYAIWFKDKNGNAITVGSTVVFRSQTWVAQDVGKTLPTADWTGKSSDFKGFFRIGQDWTAGCNTQSNVVAGGSVVTKGGDACGSSGNNGNGNGNGNGPATEGYWFNIINTAWHAGQPIIVAVLDHEVGNGSANVTIETFAALDISGNSPKNGQSDLTCSQDLSGVVIKTSPTLAGFIPGSGTPPPSSGGCGTGFGICTPKLVQ